MGAQAHVGEFGSSPGLFSLSRQKRRELRGLVEGSIEPSLLVDPRTGMHIVDVNQAFADVTFTTRGRIEGERLFTALPGNPEDESVAVAFQAYKICAQTRQRHTLPVQKYDVIDSAGVVRKRRWRSSYHPFLDDSGRLAYILNRLVLLSAD